MANESKKEQIEAAVLTLMQTISVANGDWYDYHEIGRQFRTPDQVNDFPVIFVPPGRLTGEQLVSTTDRVLELAIYGMHNTETTGTQINRVAQDIETALYSDGVKLGVAFVIGVNVRTIDTDQSLKQDNKEVCVLEVEVKFRADRGDP